MSDFDWDHELSVARRNEVHRRLTIDDRDYDVLAFNTGGGFIAVRMAGWDGGCMTTEIAGELPAADALDVVSILASALTHLRPSGESGDPPDDWWAAHRAAAPNAGKPWDRQDLELLVTRFREGATVKTLTAELGRTEGGVRSRLQLLGLTRADPEPGPLASVPVSSPGADSGPGFGEARPTGGAGGSGEPEGRMPMAG
ncbi:hypothetical protein [Dactylosporangium fulvum]|uniref:DNA-binding protein n=1 Tax=Dactylosporangium fulvum TaxID=53359 RepID=A0ABY5W030_9ACTN|nr:hypothetical protein [Dactylosporangium fulvum]UWP82624.1 hypothetical protein Dfulv_47645 [Dactylosporangium fulvum]